MPLDTDIRLGRITLDEMDSIRLMNRIDTKYLTDGSTLPLLLADAARQGYRALVTGESVTAGYDTVYFDTPLLQMYLDHHNRRLVREKVRTRQYVGTRQCFLEIKKKNNHGRTRKKRTQIQETDFMDFSGNDAACGFLRERSKYPLDTLSPSLETFFDRITLVNPLKTERVTIDTHVSFKNLRGGCTANLGNAVIIEVKQDGRADSQMKRILLGRRVKPLKISKYCIGITLTAPGVKKNRFKLRVKQIEKQINQKICSDQMK